MKANILFGTVNGFLATFTRLAKLRFIEAVAMPCLKAAALTVNAPLLFAVLALFAVFASPALLEYITSLCMASAMFVASPVSSVKPGKFPAIPIVNEFCLE